MYLYIMENAGPDYKKLYEESLERLARAEAEIALKRTEEEEINRYKQQISSHKQQISSHQQEISIYRQELALLHLELNQLRRKMFGIRSDSQLKGVLEGQLELFTLGAAEVAVLSSDELLKQEATLVNAELDKKPRNPRTAPRMVFPADMERQDLVIDPEGDLSAYHVISEEVTEILVHEPGRFRIKRIVRRRWALNDSSDVCHKGILIAPIPSRTVKRGLFDESVLAQLLISKYVDHLPLYRQKKIFEREGIIIPSSTISDNTGAACKALIPIYNALKRETLANIYLQVDETGCPVLKGGKKGSCHKGYFWVYHAPADGLVFFDYQQGRDHSGPLKILKDFHGVLQTDGYKVYQMLFKDSTVVTQLFCMAHIRRKFDEAAAHDLERSNFAVKHIAKLYAIEKQIRESEPPMSEGGIVKLRMEEAIPVLNKMKDWLTSQQQQQLTGPIAKAVNYAAPLWDKMYGYTLHGHLQIDSNAIENAIRPVAIGRKNYMFAGTHDTAQNAAMVYSMFATCKKHDVNPERWITDVLRKINDPEYDGKYSDLMPHRWKLTN